MDDSLPFVCAHDHCYLAADQRNNERRTWAVIALTSILAIAALIAGKFRGWVFLDPVMGIVGALVIGRWSWGLMRQTGAVLLDHDQNRRLAAEILAVVQAVEGTRVEDLHVWRLGQGSYGAILAVRAPETYMPEFFKSRLSHLEDLAHLTVEVTRR